MFLKACTNDPPSILIHIRVSTSLNIGSSMEKRTSIGSIRIAESPPRRKYEGAQYDMLTRNLEVKGELLQPPRALTSGGVSFFA